MDGGGVENQNHDSGEVPVAQNGIDFGTVADPSLSTEREVSDEDLGFSSEDIAKREKTEYFTNVKGAEKIKRQEERKREAEEKERLKKLKKLEAEDIIAQKQFEAKEQDDRAEKRIILDQKLEKQKAEFAAFNNRVLNFFFRKEHRWITIGVAVALIGIAVTLIIYAPIRREEVSHVTDYTSFWDTDIKRNPYYKAIVNSINNLSDEGKDSEARSYIEDLLKKNEGHQENRCSLLIIYEQYLIANDKYGEALVKAEEAESIATTASQKDALYNNLSYIWSMLGNDEKAEEYEAKRVENYKDVKEEENKVFKDDGRAEY